MKRKIIQIANSTNLVSLPKKWCIAHGIKKGDEIDVKLDGNSVIISKEGKIDKALRMELHTKDYEAVLPRFIHAMYKKGVDEIMINIKKPEDINKIQQTLSNETVGYEIIEQGGSHCLVKHIGGSVEGFDELLRRIMTLQVSMADEVEKAIKEKDISRLKSTLVFEKSNNRFTTLCRRYLNKRGSSDARELGPLYFIVENLEKIADEYKYLSLALSERKIENISKEIIKEFEKLAQAFKLFKEGFYKKDNKKLDQVVAMRKQAIKNWRALTPKLKNPTETFIMHHAIVIMQKVFELVGPSIIINTEIADKN